MSVAAAPPLASLLAGAAQAPRDETTERILDAALAQFSALGLRRSSIEDVARRGGVSRVTVYRRFPQKDRLVEAVLLRECARFIAALDSATLAIDDPDERLVAGFVAAVRNALQHPLVGRLLETEPESVLPFLTLGSGPGLAIARAFLAEQIRAAAGDPASVPQEASEQVAEALVRLAASIVLNPHGAIDAGDEQTLRGFARRAIVTMVRAVTSPAGRPRG